MINHKCIADEFNLCFECDRDMSLPILVGLCGAAGSGKDAVATVLRKRYNYRVDSFAAPIYAGVAAMFSVHPKGRLAERSMKEKPWPALLGRTPRYLLQELGTAYGRDLVDKDIWIKLAQKRCEAAPQPSVIADVRFTNEFHWIIDRGGVLIQVIRDQAEPVQDHISETELDRSRAGYTIVNNGTLDDLTAEVIRTMDAMGSRDLFSTQETKK